jgi:hypothetical protein
LNLSVYAAGFLPNAQVARVHGKVLHGKTPLKIGDEIFKGMTITMPKRGDYLIIKYNNGHVLKLTGASIKIEELTEKVSLINLVKGQVHTLVKALSKDEKFIIKTRYASFGVRGTKYNLVIDDKGKQAYLCVCEGEVEASLGQQMVTVKKDQDLFVGSKTTKMEVKKATSNMIDMTNSVINELENI